MNHITWKYGSPLKDSKSIEKIESKYEYSLSNDLKACLQTHNAAVPSKERFDMGKNREMVFGGFLSLNSNDLDNIYEFLHEFEIDQGSHLRMFPFGLDPGGNLICEDHGKIVYIFHEEENRVIYIADSFAEFLDMLY